MPHLHPGSDQPNGVFQPTALQPDFWTRMCEDRPQHHIAFTKRLWEILYAIRWVELGDAYLADVVNLRNIITGILKTSWWENGRQYADIMLTETSPEDMRALPLVRLAQTMLTIVQEDHDAQLSDAGAQLWWKVNACISLGTAFNWDALEMCADMRRPESEPVIHWFIMLLAHEIHLQPDRWSDTSRLQNRNQLLHWAEPFLGFLGPNNGFARRIAWVATRIRSYQNDRVLLQSHRPVFVGEPGERILISVLWRADAYARDETRTRRHVRPRSRYGIELRQNRSKPVGPPFDLFKSLVTLTPICAWLIIMRP